MASAFCLSDQVIGALQGACVIAGQGRCLTIEIVLCAVIGIRSRDVQASRDVQISLTSGRGGPRSRASQTDRAFCIHSQCAIATPENPYSPTASSAPTELPTGIADSLARGKFAPVIQALPPIVQTPMS